MRGQSSNALASSIVLVCRKRPDDAPTISRREFLRELNAVLPEALDEMTKGTSDDRSPVAQWIYRRLSSGREWLSSPNTPPCWRPTVLP